MNGKKIITVIQARFNSARLPGKALLDLCGKPVLERVVDQVRQASHSGEIWVATSDQSTDDPIARTCDRLHVHVHRGSLSDVLGRFCGAVHQSQADLIVRVTADNPLTEPRFIDAGVLQMMADRYDYIYFENIPYGSGVEIITKEALFASDRMALDAQDREHVTSFMKRNPGRFHIGRFSPPTRLSRPDIRVTLDTVEDYIRLFHMFHHFGNTTVTLEKAIAYLGRGAQ
ncbi:cytidylyltransferase domain-containing protein [Ferviditalea candida]|uniref:NTP transferase domain-containing protein n=1 Tax=Ferviditalea candida TaxID=3108399 RepID=A0ABU5ZKN4_9BACL|nr:NTP transferase domain-containing protein [Paenibacillaceae bacterium T2]